ncbi:hypothetical protein G7K_3102-t1 [Saitoella complicata NRRL Y-17804]|uniref:Mitochondrial inner membrane protein 1 n=2 Tax=Saitoella complicata (strain BCRC 22490 / CBS 7301 / JCM 7358 / NBRC 10748 / NRRL Y-17804) TaxID=698492 RepID=A0A0E9NGZ7_SAICN|nr:hypothetical protein G7K_3102-t1 [Saitoella complicata NRRL Y-17804]
MLPRQSLRTINVNARLPFLRQAGWIGRQVPALSVRPFAQSFPALNKKDATSDLTKEKWDPKIPDSATTGTASNTRKDPVDALKDDVKAVAATFEGVPRDAQLAGVAGTIPYVVTSLAALYCGWDIQTAGKITEIGDVAQKMMIDPSVAHQLLAFLEPIQIGYGACILSFLGAIHWGLEFAKYGDAPSRLRYAVGVAPTLIAWPTVMLPAQFALSTQFVGFTVMYAIDSAMTKRGYTPRWYAQYRFMLTAVVCSSILFTLLAKGWMRSPEAADPGAIEQFKKYRSEEWANLDVAEGREHPQNPKSQTQVKQGERGQERPDKPKDDGKADVQGEGMKPSDKELDEEKKKDQNEKETKKTEKKEDKEQGKTGGSKK